MAIAPPDGVALSCTSCGRTTSRSPSSGVSKKPPSGCGEVLEDHVHRAPRPPSNQRSSNVASYSGEQPVREVRVVLEHAVGRRPAVLPRAPEPAVRPRGGRRGPRRPPATPPRAYARRRLDQRRLAGRGQRPRGVRERGDREPVPGREHLVVARRLRPRGRAGAAGAARAVGQPVGDLRRRRARTAPPSSASPRTRDRIVRPSQLPASVTPYAAANSGGGVAQDLAHLAGRPDERRRPPRPPCPRPGWRRTRRPAVAQLAEHVVEHPGRRRQQRRVAGERPRVDVHARELGVVVEHLLEVRARATPRRSRSGGSRRPAGRGCRPPPSRRGSGARPRAARASPLATCRRSRNSIVIGCGNFGARPQPPWTGSNEAATAAAAASSASRGGIPIGPAAGPDRLRLDQRVDEPHARLLHLRPLGRPRGPDAVEHLAERRHPVARRVGEVGAAVERPALGREEHAHRPAAAARSSPGRRPCTAGRGRGAPRGRP